MAWGLTQHAISASFASGTSASKAFSSSPASGSLLLAMLFVNNNSATISSAPTGASITGSWVALAGASGVHSTALAAQSFQAFGAINNATGTSTISLSWTGAGTGDFVIAEFSGITGSVVQDGSIVTANSTTTSITTPSFTPGVTGDLLIQAGMYANGCTSASGGTPAWTGVDTQTQLTGTSDGWGWQAGALSAVAANQTSSGTTGTTSLIFAVEASGGTVASIPDLIMAPPHR